MQLYLALISCLVCAAHCWQFDGGGGSVQQGQRSLRVPRNTARALAARGPPPGRGSAALLGSQQQDVLYACPLNSMCQCAGMPNETSTLIEINCNEVALYKFPGETERGAGWGMGRHGSWTWKWKWKVAAADAVKPLHILVSDGTGRQATQRGCQYFLRVGEGKEKVAEAAQAAGAARTCLALFMWQIFLFGCAINCRSRNWSSDNSSCHLPLSS